MKLYKQHFVGLDHSRTDVTTAPLAYMMPYEDNAAGRKRQESVRNWLRGWDWKYQTSPKTQQWYQSIRDAGGTAPLPEDIKDPLETATDKETKIVDNVAKTGFKVVDFATRDLTANKFVRLYDPDGFEVELTIENLLELMSEHTIERGEIKAELIWLRDGSYNRLVSLTSPHYQKSVAADDVSVIRYDVGDTIKNSRFYHSLTYLGTGYVQHLALIGKEKLTKRTDHSFFGFSSGRDYKMQISDVVGSEVAKKKHHLYLNNNDNSLVIRTRKMVASKNLGQSRTDHQWDENTLFTIDSESRKVYSAAGEFNNSKYTNSDYRYISHIVRVLDSNSDIPEIEFKDVYRHYEYLKMTRQIIEID